MKRFHELTKEQQKTAISFALTELKDLLEKGVVRFDRPASDEVLQEYAICAAEDAYYSEMGDKVIDDIIE